MKIVKLYIENIKAYESAAFDFYEGINFICGHNGVGKSTIFECIGLVLFNNLEYVIDDFIRYGEKKAVIKLWFEAGDERVYCIQRNIGTSKNYFIIDEETGEELDLHGNDDVQSWLKKNLGDTVELSLKEIFSQIIGVYQGKFTEPFLMTIEAKKNHFNRLLQIDQYKKANKLSSNFETYFSGQIKDKMHEIDKAATSLKYYNEKASKLADINKHIIELEKQRIELVSKKNAVGEKYLLLEQLRIVLEQSTSQLNIANIELNHLEKTIYEKEILLNKSEIAVKICEENKQSVVAVVNARKELDKLKSQEEIFSRLNNDINSLQEKINILRVRKEEKTSQSKNKFDKLNEDIIRESSKSEEIQNKLKNSVTAFNEHEEQVKVIKKQQEVLELFNRIIQDMQVYREKARNVFDENQMLSGETNDIQKQMVRIEEIKKVLDTAGQINCSFESCREKLTILQSKYDDYKHNENLLEQAMCPFFETKCNNLSSDAKVMVNDQSKQLEAKINLAQQEFNELQLSKSHLEKMQEEYRTLIQLQKVLEEKDARIKKNVESIKNDPIRKKVTDLLEQIEKVNILFPFAQTIQESFDRYQLHLDSFVIQFDALNELCNSMGDFYIVSKKSEETDFSQLQEKRNAVFNDISINKKYKEDCDQKIAKLKLELINLEKETVLLKALELETLALDESFVSKKLQRDSVKLDIERIAQLNSILDNNRSQYEFYLQHNDNAQKYPLYKSETAELKAKIQEVVQRIANTKIILKDNQQGFNEHEYNSLKEQRDSSIMESSANEEKIKLFSEERDQLRRDIGMIIEIKKNIENWEKEIESIKKKLEIIQTSRRVLEKIGEPIAAMFRERISHLAENIYHNISQQHAKLLWGQGYEVYLIDNHKGRDRQRVFRQLSGGEQMSVALAIRMALIQYFSSLRIAFFDEPTTNLDEMHRHNLASILPKICEDFDQVFLISHDDSFDSITDNVLSI
ncbi:MAG: hypothetical protein DKM50_14000 [Candidatus Margulisiibacteriota bacterium]|nr:MAG: hypothetical protein A2X43_01130 [Candidatus Margulisbacteria bacterium GWD2_39_127]OGI03323.1 MAG: hypothetical protein A2X42_06915 [Candidatus Margulisbacteria bacterium GWF2_38_17]OGI12007.1 MAG: hypothetical protein A2X41_02995 [Candidatus Margulisbacteria bacterium GWE2_39_32]PZM77046.1 MAG: hypothetical protein DKM50_14000 [Candidatus Margulisiibacteriota bacterium]HAR63179.1 hypothetical protein [Candidatus Margulisiibacteriota bacterium]